MLVEAQGGVSLVFFGMLVLHGFVGKGLGGGGRGFWGLGLELLMLAV